MSIYKIPWKRKGLMLQEIVVVKDSIIYSRPKEKTEKDILKRTVNVTCKVTIYRRIRHCSTDGSIHRQ